MTRTIQKKGAWIFAVGFLFLALCAPAAHGACLNWEHELGAPDQSLLYEGKLGDQLVRMMLHLDTKAGRFDGAYGYADQPGTLSLTGSMLSGPPGAGMTLDEHDQQGRVTAHFTLRFFYPIPSGMTASFYKKYYSDTCDSLVGSWQPASGGKALRIALRVNGSVLPSDQEEMKANDVTAYKLKQAMLGNDRKALASLVYYPFCTASFRTTKAWLTPAEVMKHYKQIASMVERVDWIRAIPHFNSNDYVNGSVDFYQGKVAMICEGRCPVVPSDWCEAVIAPEQQKLSAQKRASARP